VFGKKSARKNMGRKWRYGDCTERSFMVSAFRARTLKVTPLSLGRFPSTTLTSYPCPSLPSRRQNFAAFTWPRSRPLIGTWPFSSRRTLKSSTSSLTKRSNTVGFRASSEMHSADEEPHWLVHEE
jgi:hypothetical protein